MIRHKHINIVLFLLGFIVVGFVSAHGATKQAQQSPEALVKKVLETVMKIQNDPKLQGHENRYKRALEIKKIIHENFDSYGMAKKSIEEYWKSIPNTKKSKFSRVFSDLFQDSYTRLVLNFLKKEQIEYLGEEIKGGKAEVKTAIIRANDKIMVDYYLKKVKGRWIIEDVSIDGVSIVGNYRSIFHREIARNSFDSLLKKMVIQQKAIKMSLSENKKA